jgi:hypothetical protein
VARGGDGRRPTRPLARSLPPSTDLASHARRVTQRHVRPSAPTGYSPTPTTALGVRVGRLTPDPAPGGTSTDPAAVFFLPFSGRQCGCWQTILCWQATEWGSFASLVRQASGDQIIGQERNNRH